MRAAAELVRVSAALVDTAARVAAFGITYPRRVQRLSDKSAPTCRALAQLLILKLGADRDILDARVMFVSPDAVASEIVDLGWYHRDHPTLDQVIKVRSRAFYGSPTWFAEIDWEEVVEPESLAHIAAAPVTAAKAEFGGRAVAGQFTQPEVSEDAVQLTLAGMLQPGNTPFSHTFSVPRSGGVLSGWSILLSF